MWRALFWAIGVYAVLLGAQFMLIDHAVLHDKQPSGGAFSGLSMSPAQNSFVPPEWAPWSLITFGIITLLYSFTIPKRIGE